MLFSGTDDSEFPPSQVRDDLRQRYHHSQTNPQEASDTFTIWERGVGLADVSLGALDPDAGYTLNTPAAAISAIEQPYPTNLCQTAKEVS